MTQLDDERPNPRGAAMTDDERAAYSTYVGFAQQAEVNSWNRFYNFLMFNTILILAWATVYGQVTRPHCARLVLAVFCVFGGASGATWSFLGRRGREYGTFFLEHASEFEKNIPDKQRVCTEVLRERVKLPHRYLGSFVHLVWWPWGFVGLYVLLFIVSLAG